MENNSWLYRDIAERTHGDIYIGVVGPVRCGKSTFINKCMQNFVLPNIEDKNDKLRATDELPQSSDGTLIMTTKPQFIPNEAVKINLNKVDMKVRFIDCVGYVVDGATGYLENNKPRLIDTPWSDKKMTFTQAATIGTQKVIQDHSTIAIVLTTDGSFGDIKRESFIPAERKIIKELQTLKKPFVVVVNSKDPNGEPAKNVCKDLTRLYGVSCLSIDVNNLSKGDIDNIMTNVLAEFSVESIDVKIPSFLRALPFENPIVQEILTEINKMTANKNSIKDFKDDVVLFENSENFEPIISSNIVAGEGRVEYDVVAKSNLYFKVLSFECGKEINNDYELVSFIKELTASKSKYDKIKDALEQVNETGYGVVMPCVDEMELGEPEIVKQGTKCGVKLRATAPSLHIMKVDVQTEVSPVMGGVKQSEDMAQYLLQEFENNPQGIWQTNMFGKSLESLVNEDLNNKLSSMPTPLQAKLRRTLTRIVNEGKGGIICILL